MRAPGSHEKGKSCFKPTQLSSPAQLPGPEGRGHPLCPDASVLWAPPPPPPPSPWFGFKAAWDVLLPPAGGTFYRGDACSGKEQELGESQWKRSGCLVKLWGGEENH